MPVEPIDILSNKFKDRIPGLLLMLLWQIAVLVVPIFLVATLPLLWGMALALLLATSMGLTAKLGWMRIANGHSRLFTSVMIGVGFALGRTIPDTWGIVSAFLWILLGLAAAATYERRLGLSTTAPESTDSSPLKGGSAWGGDEPVLTPEGEPIRAFNWGEIAMGGPAYCDYLFPDGVLLEGIGTSALFSSDGRYFAAPLPSRDVWGLLILDRQEKRLYRCKELDNFWELDEFRNGELRGRYSPLVSNQGYKVPLDELLAQAEVADLAPLADLWLAPEWLERSVAQSIEFPAPNGGPVLRGSSYLPASLRELDQPTEPLRYPCYRLEIEGEPSGLLMDADEPVIWLADGRALVCRARPEAALEQRWPMDTWLWRQGQGWKTLAAPWVAAPSEPSLSWGRPAALDEQHVWIEAYLDYAQTDHLGFGYQLSSIHSDTEALVGHDKQGRAQVGEFRLTRLQLVVSLGGQGERGAAEVQTQPLVDGQTARLRWLRDSRDGQHGAYSCHIGDWQLPGEWLLDHRVSDCGQYLALVAFAEAPAAPSQVSVADVRQRQLMTLEQPLLVARLQDFREGVLSLAHIGGRLTEAEKTSPLRRFAQAVPAPEQAARFIVPREGSRLYYQRVELQVEEQGIHLLPQWRSCEGIPAANAEGDFVLPAPNGRDAAWLFGAESEYTDSYIRERHPRQGGCLLTASGCALADLAPAMIWSEDGRYLALTRFIDRFATVGEVGRQWFLLLLDLQDKTLRCSSDSIGLMPLFERFDATGIEVRLFEYDWQVEEDIGQVRRLELAQLLQLPSEPLQTCDALWLPAEEQHRADQWQALDSNHLQAWRQS